MVVRATSVILVLVILIDLFFSSLSGTLGNYFEGHWPAIASSIGLMLLAMANFRFFSLKDDHEFIHIRSGSALLPFGQSPAAINFEFLKKNISHFSVIEKGPSKKLHLQLSADYRGSSDYSFSLSFFTASDIERLNQLLAKSVRKPVKSGASPLVNVS